MRSNSISAREAKVDRAMGDADHPNRYPPRVADRPLMP
jgi:hypothetical protein